MDHIIWNNHGWNKGWSIELRVCMYQELGRWKEWPLLFFQDYFGAVISVSWLLIHYSVSHQFYYYLVLI